MHVFQTKKQCALMVVYNYCKENFTTALEIL